MKATWNLCALIKGKNFEQMFIKSSMADDTLVEEVLKDILSLKTNCVSILGLKIFNLNKIIRFL